MEMALTNSTTAFPMLVTTEKENLLYNTSGRETGPVMLFVNYFVLFVSVIVVVCDALAVHVLRKCRRIPRRCLYFSISFIVSDAVNSAIFSVFQLSIYGFNFYNDIIHFSRIFMSGIMNNISSASVTAVTLERVIALKANIRYSKGLSGTCVKLIIIFLWMFHAIVIIASIAVGIGNQCSWELLDCNFFEATRIARFAAVGVMGFYDIILVCSNIYICRIARRHIRHIIEMKRMASSNTITNADNISERQYATTQAVIYIVIAYLILQTPINIHIVVSETSDTIRHELFMRVLLGVSYLCLLAHSFINLFLYVGKFKECKMHFYFAMARFSKRFENQAEQLRLDVYNIVVSSEVAKVTRSDSTI